MADADDSTDSIKATNVSLTPPEQDLRDGGRDYPPGHRERVPVDSGGLHAAPSYAAAPGRTMDPDADPASPAVRGGPLAAAAGPAGAAGAAPAANDLDECAKPAANDLDECAKPAAGNGAG